MQSEDILAGLLCLWVKTWFKGWGHLQTRLNSRIELILGVLVWWHYQGRGLENVFAKVLTKIWVQGRFMKTSGKSTQFCIIIGILIKKKIQLTHSLNLMAAVHTLVWWKRWWNETGMDEVLWLQMKEDEGAIEGKGIFMDETSWLISNNKKWDCGPGKLASLAASFWPYFDFKTGLCTGTARAEVKRRWNHPLRLLACFCARCLTKQNTTHRKVSFVLIKLTLGTLAGGQKHCEWQTDRLDMDFDLLLVKMMIR